jgi:hemolysin III
MILLDLREPVSACSHGAAMMLALPLAWIFWQRCGRCPGTDQGLSSRESDRTCHYEQGKLVALLIFGLSLIFCYGASALYHSVLFSGDRLNRFRRLDHVGIYVLIAGTYTPGVWALFRRGWRQGTLACVWGFAILCAGRVWFGGILPPWVSTIIYLTMGWGVLLCYRELARNLSHRALLPLPLGGAFYSVGALINLMNWPVLKPGVVGAHELFHFLVIAGSACHASFMLRVVVPARQPADWQAGNPAWRPRLIPGVIPVPLGTRVWAQLGGLPIRRPHLNEDAEPAPAVRLNPAEP